MKKINILVLRNFTVEPILDQVRNKLKKKNLKAKFLLSGYDSTVNELMNKKSKIYSLKPDLIIFFFSIDSYFKDLKITKKTKKLIYYKINDDLKIIFSILKKNFSTEIGICSLYESLYKKNKSLSRIINKKINLECLKNRNFNFLDINSFLKDASFNSKSRKFWKHSMYPFNFQSGDIVSEYLFKFITRNNGKSHKIIILDADNTLWPGIIGEENPKEIKIKKNKKSYNHYSFQKELKILKNRGILLALNSKNNLQDVKNFFKLKSKIMPLKISDFCKLKVNWEPKSQNIVKILEEMNLSIDNALFIDDSKFEIGEVKSKLKKLDTLLIPDKISKFKKIFHQTGNFNTTKSTFEDKKRSKLYLDEDKRKKISIKFKDNNDYIRSLKIKLEIKVNSRKNLSRLAQMTQKTNQFNSTTLRLNELELSKLMLNDKSLIFQCRAEDILGDYGIIGLAIIKIDKILNLAKIENTLFSCRALGRKIEEYFYQKVVENLKDKRIKNIEINYIKSDKNKLFYDFLKKYEFKKIILKKDKFIFKKQLKKINFTNKFKLISYI